MALITHNGENYITINGIKYVIMEVKDYVALRLSFIDDGKEIERVSRMGMDAKVLGMLSFYSSEGNYLPVVSDVPLVDPEHGLMQKDLSRVAVDNGEMARDVIAAMEAMED